MKLFRAAISAALLLFTLTACAHNSQVIVGTVKADELLANHPEFNRAYRQAAFTDKELAQVKSWPKQLKITTYFGSWCHDSQREVPKMLKLLASRPALSSQLIALDLNKSEPAGRALDAGIAFTPTFVISLQGREIGRIIERPTTSLVGDISAMLAM